MKIPTLLALIFLSVLIIVGINFKSYIAQIMPIKKSPTSLTTQSNLTPQSITISWLTTDSVPSKLIYTTDKSFLKDVHSAGDDRESQSLNQTVHLITLQELQPNTTYYFKIDSQPLLGQTQQFTTPAEKSTDSKIVPLVGSVTQANLQPVSDALVMLEVPNYFPLLTYTNKTGNFILPIKLLFSKSDLSQTLDLSRSSVITLVISKPSPEGNQTSKVSLSLSQLQNPLPPVILGQDLDLTIYPTTSSTEILPSPTPQFNFDVNSDGKVNSLDLTTVQNNIGKKKFNFKADINGDGLVDQKDLDLIRQAIKNP